VTDGSTDNTNKLLGDYSNITLFFDPPRQGKSSAINRVMPFIDKPITIFTDANAMVNSQAIKEIVREFTDPKVGCVAGEKRVCVNTLQNATAGEGIYWKYESKLKELDYRLYSAVGAAGELFSVRTNLFITLPADTLLDDFVMSMKIADEGYKIAYSKEAYAMEQASLNMNEENKRKVRIAAGGMQSIGRLISFLNPFKHPILSFQYISHRVLRWTITPIALFLLLPLNIWLVVKEYHTCYAIMLVLQVLFYLAALGGWLLALKQIKNKYLFIPYYFITMNVNVIRGFNYLRKTKGSGIWERAKRAN
jgi:cellulose synthase/poly-beta-1,6-N-acetylglucosamine synthase-like glycosyltransferase